LDSRGGLFIPKFQKGQPRRPRLRGSRNSVNVILDRLAVESAETMVKKMIEVVGDSRPPCWSIVGENACHRHAAK
jgi:hypothetical protein